jgi:hypothetical protein
MKNGRAPPHAAIMNRTGGRLMGLEEKRAIKAAVEGWLPQRQAELKELCGGDVPYEIDWPSFEGDLKGHNWLEFNGPAQVGMAFRQIGSDDLGKESLRGIKKVVVKNVKTEAEKKLSFEGSVLTLLCAFAKSPGGRFTDGEIRDCLMKGL